MSDFELLSVIFAAIGIIVSVLIAWIKDINSRKK